MALSHRAGSVSYFFYKKIKLKRTTSNAHVTEFFLYNFQIRFHILGIRVIIQMQQVHYYMHSPSRRGE